MKNKIALFIIIIVAATLYGLTLRGVWGNPEPLDIKNNLDQSTKPFELSPERGRYAHVYSLAENHTYTLSRVWAYAVYPDVGIYNGKFYSFFAPGISYLTVGFYLIGSAFGLGQVFSYATISVLALCSLIFIFKISRQIFKLPLWPSLFAVIIFGFGSTSWSYAITLYQHHATVFFMLSAYYAVWRYRQKSKASFFFALYVWLAYGLAIFVDYPNGILMLPVMIYFAYSSFTVSSMSDKVTVSFRTTLLSSMVMFVAIMSLHFYHNIHYYGSWKNLSGGLKTFTDPALDSRALNAQTISTITTTSDTAVATTSLKDEAQPKNVVGFFKESYLPQSFYTLIASSDRGLLFFSPIFLLSVFGIVRLIRKPITPETAGLLGIIATNIFLYSSWGDPWGGWAYGPRYLIISMAPLSICAAIAMMGTSYRWLKKIIAGILFAFSSAIALLGALTTNAVPPQSEGILLPSKKYNYLFNIKFLQDGKSGSFVYNSFLSHSISLVWYYLIIYFFILSLAFVIIALIPSEPYSHD